MIYFIGNEELVKIGFSNNPKNRIKEVVDACPFKVKVYAITEGDREQEQFLHQQFKEQHSHKEWFFNKGAVREYLDSISQSAEDMLYRQKYFGEMKALRLKSGLSLYDMAKLLNVTPPTVDEFERNADKESIRLKTLKKYLSVLGYEIKIVKKAA